MSETLSCELVYHLLVPQYVRALNGLKVVMQKARLHAEKNNYSPNKFLDIKLAPDMFNFLRQVQIATDNAKGAVARLSGSEIPSYPDDEKTWEELVARVDKTINYIASFRPSNFKNYTETKAVFPWNPNSALCGHDYLVSFALPNFYFHVTTAYDLLRANGVNLGKADFLGELNWQKN